MLFLALLFFFLPLSEAADRVGRLHMEFSGSAQRLNLTTKASETTTDVSSDLTLLGTHADFLYLVNPKLALKLGVFASLELSSKVNYTGGSLGGRYFLGDSFQRVFIQEPELEIKKFSHKGSFVEMSIVRSSLSADVVNISFLGFEVGTGYYWSINEDYYFLGMLSASSLSGDKNRTLFGLGAQFGIGTFFY